MFVVKFVRKDDLPDEEYFYCHYEDAKYHYSLFENDNSGIYKRVLLEKVQ